MPVVDADYRTDWAGVSVPDTVDRNGANLIRFTFASNPIMPASSSKFMLVRSWAATMSTGGNVIVTDGSTFCSVTGTYQP